MKIAKVSLALIVSCSSLCASADAAVAAKVGAYSPIKLTSGVNHITAFSADGRDARIVLAWRDNANAHGYDVFLVLMPTRRGGTDWNVVGFEDGNEFQDQITDAPHTGEDVARAVRFVTTLSRGRRVPLVATATRSIKTSYPDPATTVVSLYALAQSEGVPGTTTDYFKVVRKWTTKRTYCNAELALQDELGIPVRQDYAGSKNSGGC